MHVRIHLNAVGFQFIQVVQLLFTIDYQVLFNTDIKLHLLIPLFTLIEHCFVKATIVRVLVHCL